AQELGCNKIALGHHMDDIIHTALMNQFFQGQFSTMPARLTMKKMPLTIIRPLCMEIESDIAQYAKMRGYEKQVKLCPFETASHRSDIRKIYEEAERINPEVRYSIWNALETAGKMIE
ncbi:MAG: tRNA 2-thiocytidine(32) synthetase TtcA, partial [Prevotella sp.]|nr:tRNA 2-thiocytidine(32) synthetase TtcA [Prevotella sp.]